jgi:endonuclease III-like uncharacterized protein
MGTVLTKKTIWKNVHGESKPLDQLEDSHLANIIHWSKFYMPDHTELIAVVTSILEDRGISEKFVDRAQIPYKNPYGKLEIWDFENHCQIEISE